MKGRMFEVVAYITQRCHEQGGRVSDPVELREELLDAGYHEDDVERALGWLQRLHRNDSGSGEWLSAPTAAQRIPDELELRKLSTEARGFLLTLERKGLLEPLLREAVYERALSLDVPELGTEEIRLLVALLLDSRPGVDHRTVSAILQDELELLVH